MRTFEILLLMANFVAFLVLVTSLPGTILGAKWVPAILLFIIIIQILMEGGRWQMVPAYVVTGILLLMQLLQYTESARKIFDLSQPSSFFIGVGVFGMALTFLLPLLFPVFQIPHPRGPYAIGTLTYHWKDEARRERYTKDPTDVRELIVQIWYPAEAANTSRDTPYIEDPAVLAPLAHLLKIPPFALGHLKYITTNSHKAVPAANDKESYPVLVFSHGRGGFRQHNSFQIEELVSNGYIVAAIDHTYAASGVLFPDGRLVSMDARMLERTFVDRMIPYLAQDVSFTVDQLNALNRSDPQGILTGKLDLQEVGIFGLSLGGQVAAEASLMDPRLKACLVMDVAMPANVLKEGLRQPTMWISRDEETMKLEGWSKEAISETYSSMRTVFEKLPTNGYFVQVPGMFHPNFSDAPLFSPLVSQLGLAGPIDKHVAHHIVSDYSLAFFDRHLKDQTETLLEEGTERYDGVLFESR